MDPQSAQEVVDASAPAGGRCLTPGASGVAVKSSGAGPVDGIICGAAGIRTGWSSPGAYGAPMTDLIPNLDDLLASLPASAARDDAAELAVAVRDATTWAEVDAVLDDVVTRWATP